MPESWLWEAGCCSRQPNQPFKKHAGSPKGRVPDLSVYIDGKFVFDSRKALIELNCEGGFGTA